MEPTYDLAFSFAGEDRDYARELKQACEKLGLKVYFDEDRKLDQWGLSFLAEQRKVYSGYKTKHFIPLISQYYFSKPIPTDEFKAAMMESTKRRYMLPVKLDDSSISVEYLSADMQQIKSSEYSIEKIAQQLKKLVDSDSGPAKDVDTELDKVFELPMPKLTPNDYIKYEQTESLLNFIAKQFQQQLPKLKSYGYNFIVRSTDEDVKIRVSKVDDTIWALNVFYGSMSENSLGYNHDESLSYSRSSHSGYIEPFFDTVKQIAAYKLQAFMNGSDDEGLSQTDIVAFFWNDLSEKLERDHG